jgi:hypothetical protein
MSAGSGRETGAAPAGALITRRRTSNANRLMTHLPVSGACGDSEEKYFSDQADGNDFLKIANA